MDKYHIYEEVGAGKHSQVFKGREKMDIEYVAIKRVEKSMMDQVVKEVQVRILDTRYDTLVVRRRSEGRRGGGRQG